MRFAAMCLAACVAVPAIACAQVRNEAANDAPEVECDFDQAQLRANLDALAAREPGGQVVAEDGSVVWRQADGANVRAGESGCVDLGVVVAVEFAPGKRPDEATTLRRLVRAVADYWSRDDAATLEGMLASGTLQRSVDERGVVILSGSSVDESLPGVEIHIEDDSISVSWSTG